MAKFNVKLTNFEEKLKDFEIMLTKREVYMPANDETLDRSLCYEKYKTPKCLRNPPQLSMSILLEISRKYKNQ